MQRGQLPTPVNDVQRLERQENGDKKAQKMGNGENNSLSHESGTSTRSKQQSQQRRKTLGYRTLREVSKI